MSEAADTIREADSGDMLEAVLAMPDHLSDALWRIESAKLEAHPDAPQAVVCGMGGSAIGGDLAAAALGSRLIKPMITERGYELPPACGTSSLVLCSSYSGNTEETLACFAGAEALGAQRIVATTGGELADLAREAGVPVIGLPAGLQPRAAVGYMFCVSAELAALAGAAPRLNTEIDSSATHLAEVSEELIEQAAEIAGRLAGATPVIYGSGLTSPIAYRWKAQMNENGKLPAFSSAMPEADHNEIVGWQGAKETGKYAAIFLHDRDQHPRERRRFELTARLIDPYAEAIVDFETVGESRTERLLHAVMLGDLVSLHLAAARGIDPTPVDVIEDLKEQLGRP
jgi:glucose/mannose-6-phosphate isomerase